MPGAKLQTQGFEYVLYASDTLMCRIDNTRCLQDPVEPSLLRHDAQLPTGGASQYVQRIRRDGDQNVGVSAVPAEGEAARRAFTHW